MYYYYYFYFTIKCAAAHICITSATRLSQSCVRLSYIQYTFVCFFSPSPLSSPHLTPFVRRAVRVGLGSRQRVYRVTWMGSLEANYCGDRGVRSPIFASGVEYNAVAVVSIYRRVYGGCRVFRRIPYGVILIFRLYDGCIYFRPIGLELIICINNFNST